MRSFPLTPASALSLCLFYASLLVLPACVNAEADGDTPAAEQTGPGSEGAEEAQEAPTYTVNGAVRGIDLEGLSVTIQHEDVAGYMPAMTMPFSLESAAQVEGIEVSDNVTFTFRPAPGGRHFIVRIAKR